VALDLYDGDLLPEDRYEEWVENRGAELRTLYLALLVELVGLHEEREEREQAVEALARVVAEELSRRRHTLALCVFTRPQAGEGRPYSGSHEG
jgi:two-component SAPR family response regulator